MKKISSASYKKGSNYVGEIVVLDETTNKKYYVVCQIGDLFYKTFESSYIDYLKGKVSTEPVMLEGEDYMWFNVKKGLTLFQKYYMEALRIASEKEHSLYVKLKYSKMKKPLGLIKFEALDADAETLFSCGPIGDRRQIRFYLPDEKREVYVLNECTGGDIYALADFDIMHCKDENMDIESKAIEIIWNKANLKNSKYYDLYYTMEQYKDGLVKIQKKS